MAKYKWQHYLPQMYLRAWTDPERAVKGQHDVWVYRAGDEAKPRGPKGVASEPHLYTVKEVPEDPATAEKGLAEMEDVAIKHLEKLRGGDIKLTDQEKREFASYMGLQISRTPLAFARSNTIAVELICQGSTKTLDEGAVANVVQQLEAAQGEKIGVDLESLEKLLRDVADCRTEVVQESTGWNVKVMFERAMELGDLLETMHWGLLEAPAGLAFITSDNPVHIADPPAKAAGPKGFKRTKAMQFAFPISPRYLLFGDFVNRPDEKAILNAVQVAKFNIDQIEFAYREIYASFRSDQLRTEMDAIFMTRAPLIPKLPPGMLDD